MGVRRIRCFSLAVEHKAGVMASVAKTLKAKNVDLAAVWGFGMGSDRAEIICQPSDPELFRKVADEAGWTIREGSAFAFTGEDQVGALVEMLDSVAGKGINVEAITCVAVNRQYGGCVWAQEGEADKLGKILGA